MKIFGCGVRIISVERLYIVFLRARTHLEVERIFKTFQKAQSLKSQRTLPYRTLGRSSYLIQDSPSSTWTSIERIFTLWLGSQMMRTLKKRSNLVLTFTASTQQTSMILMGFRRRNWSSRTLITGSTEDALGKIKGTKRRPVRTQWIII